MRSPFGNVQFIPGLGYVEADGQSPAPRGTAARAAGALGDESAVMMISGLGRLGDTVGQSKSDVGEGGSSLTRYFGQRRPGYIVAFGIELPWWAWALMAIGAVSSGWFVMQKLKKSK